MNPRKPQKIISHVGYDSLFAHMSDIYFQHADNMVFGLLAFINGVLEEPSWSFSNAVRVCIIQSFFNNACLRSFSEDGQSAPTSFYDQWAIETIFTLGRVLYLNMIFLICHFISLMNSTHLIGGTGLSSVWVFCCNCKLYQFIYLFTNLYQLLMSLYLFTDFFYLNKKTVSMYLLQFTSSDLSPQSLAPLHTRYCEIQWSGYW